MSPRPFRRAFPPRPGHRRPLPWWGWLAAGAGFLLLMALEWRLCLAFPSVSAFCQRAATALARVLAFVSGLLPIPLCELLLVGLTVGWLICLLRHAVRREGGRLLRALCRLCAMLCAMAFLFVALYGAHHTAPSLAHRLGLTVERYTPAQLEGLVARTVDMVNRLAPSVTRDGDGRCDFGGFGPLNDRITDAYASLADEYAFYDRRPMGAVKRSFLGGRVMSYVDLAGFYCPWTAESVVSSDVVDSHIPFNIAHEMAHGMGIGPEAECNFSAWLACTASACDDVRYSGWLCAFVYGNNALAAVDREAWQRQYGRLCREALLDLQVLTESLEPYEDTAVNKLGSQANDALIKATGQPEGKASYGRMIDLMLAYYSSPAQ